MSHVVTSRCIGCKDKSCVVVCPVEAFYEGPDQLFINPDVCVDCEACVVECPVDAIFYEEDIPSELLSDIEINRLSVGIYPVAVRS